MSIEHIDYDEEPRFYYYREEPEIIELHPGRVISHLRDALMSRKHNDSDEIQVGERLEAALRRREQQPELPDSDV
jgi:hypothetical protein